MTTAENNRQIDYVEFPVTNIEAAKTFYGSVFGWTFEDYGSDYTSFADGRLSGGFYSSSHVQTGGLLIVIYAVDIEDMQKKIEAAGGTIIKPTFEFPGGRRFHFRDPSGHELAVWSGT